MYGYKDFEIETLKRDALQSCVSRGHTMGLWHKHDFYRDTITYAHCEYCAMQVVVNVHPAPNDINISGMAVALTCTKTSGVTVAQIFAERE